MLKRDKIFKFTFFKYGNNNFMWYNLSLKKNKKHLALNNSEILRFSPDSEQIVNFQRYRFLDVVTAWKVLTTHVFNSTISNTN